MESGLSYRCLWDSSGKALNQESAEVMPAPLKVKWNRSADDVEASLRRGEVVVLMAPSTNRDRNLVIATLAYLRRGLLRKARAYVDHTLMKATDFTVAKQIFVASRGSSAVAYFFEQHLDPELQKKPELQNACTTLDRIEEAGFFSRIYLRQLHRFGERLYPATPTEKHREEGKDFAAFLERVATKPPGVDAVGGLVFPRSRIRAAILLVARFETSLYGTGPYERRIRINRDLGIEHLYICARRSENISLAEEIAGKQQNEGRLQILARHRYTQTVDGADVQAVCIPCRLHLVMQPAGRVDPSSALARALEEHIPEIEEGWIELVSLAREPGVKSKVAVRALEPGLDALDCCCSPLQTSCIEAALGGEAVEFLEWRDDPRKVIIAALAPLPTENVKGVELDTEAQEATVTVDWWKAKRKALGRNDLNLKLAIELTGWQIRVDEVA